MIYILRHGQTKLNKARVLQGISDHPLDENGISQAGSVGNWFEQQGISFSVIYSSPLKRAVQTAELASPGSRIQLDRRLIELDCGPYEGVNLNSPPEELRRFFSDFIHQPAPKEMESLQEVVHRTGSFVEQIRGLTGDILISTHAIAMKGILEYLTPESGGSYWNQHIGNCTVYAAENEEGRIAVPKLLFTLEAGEQQEKA